MLACLGGAVIPLTHRDAAALAQPGGGMGGFPTSPQTMFGKKKDNREVSGPTLSATDEPVADIRVVGN